MMFNHRYDYNIKLIPLIKKISYSLDVRVSSFLNKTSKTAVMQRLFKGQMNQNLNIFSLAILKRRNVKQNIQKETYAEIFLYEP